MSKHFTLPYEGGLIEKDLPAGILHTYEKIWTHVYSESRPASYAIADIITDAINAQTVAMNDQFCAAKERDLQSKIDTQADIITQLRNQISNDKQTEAFTAAFNTLNQKITELSARQPNTVPVVWPNLQAVNATPYVSGGYYQGGFNGFYGPGAGGFSF